MKGKHINTTSSRRQLGLSSKGLRLLDSVVGDIDPKNASVTISVKSDGRMVWLVKDSPIAPNLSGSHSHGVHVMYETDYAVGLDRFVVSAPWSVILKGALAVNHGVYMITLFSPEAQVMLEGGHGSSKDDKISYDVDTGRLFCYIGKTSVGVALRFKQHLYAMSTGCRTQLYRAMRGTDKVSPQLPRFVALLGTTRTEDEAYELEEAMIAKHSEMQGVMLLNRIGSRESLRQLLEQFPEYENERISPEMAAEYLANLSTRMIEQWDDPDYAKKVICNNPRNLGYEDVMSIRLLSSLGESQRVIAGKLDIDMGRVKRVISGASYSRIL